MSRRASRRSVAGYGPVAERRGVGQFDDPRRQRLRGSGRLGAVAEGIAV